ncbi:MAG TPA: sugar phosphate isomerase/epimerase [Candidatus Hydrogenedentes bacterium]|nr:sugar phosphate isomerase/epimerase [Candidatus Hydrogenedentota bacterium]
MKFGICNEIFQEWNDFARMCDYVKDVGYDGVEIAPFTFAGNVADISAETRKEIVARAKESDVEIIGLHWLLVGPDGMHITADDKSVRDHTVQYLKDLVDCCGELGGTRMIFGSPNQRNIADGQAYEEAFGNARGVFEQILPKLAEYGIVFCMEQLSTEETNFCHTAEQTVELVESIDHPNFQLILDTKAMVDEPLGRAETIKKYAKYLKHYHANDVNLKGPGFGDVDFAPIFEALKEIEFDEYVSVEVFDFKWGCVGIAGQSFEYMQQFV